MNIPEYKPPAQDSARVITVVETTMTRRGCGNAEYNPIRIVTQYWSLDGKLLAESDPFRRKENT